MKKPDIVPVTFFPNAFKWDKEKQTYNNSDESSNRATLFSKQYQDIWSAWIKNKDESTLSRDMLKIPFYHGGCIPNFEIDFSDRLQVAKMIQINHLPCIYKTGEEFKTVYEQQQAKILQAHPDYRNPKPCNAKCFVWGTYILRFDIDEMTEAGIQRLISDLKAMGIRFLYVPSKSDGKEKYLEDYDGDKDNLPPEVRPIKGEDGKEKYGITAARGHLYFLLDDCVDASTLVILQTKLVYYFKTKYKSYIIRGFYECCIDPAFSDDRSKSQCFFKISPERVKDFYDTGRLIYNAGDSILKKISLPEIPEAAPRERQRAAKTRQKTEAAERPETETDDPARVQDSQYFKDLIEMGIIKDPLIEYLSEKNHPIYEVTNDDGYLIQCPNWQQHTTGNDTMKYYPVGTPGHVWGGCSCLHSHCRPVGTETQRDRFFSGIEALHPEDAQRLRDIKRECEQLRSDVPLVFPVELSEENGSSIRKYIQGGYVVPAGVQSKRTGAITFNHNQIDIISLLKAMIEIGELKLSRSRRTHAETIDLDGRSATQKRLIARVNLILADFGASYIATKQTIEWAIDSLLHEREIDPVYEAMSSHLRGKEWDGKNRIDTFFENYCHQIPHGIFTHEYYQAFSRYLFTAIWCRIQYAAGKYPHKESPMTDIIPALVSHTVAGVGKTRLFKTLTYHDPKLLSQIKRSMIENTDDVRDIFSCAGDSMIAMLDDLCPLTRTLQEKCKTLSSDDHGEFRELFTSNRTQFPRGFLYVVTTNELHFLKDYDAGVKRRWAPVELIQSFSSAEDQQRIYDDLDQIWLEAKFIYESLGCEADFKPLEKILTSDEGLIARYFSYCDDLNEAIELACIESINRYELLQKQNKAGFFYYRCPHPTYNEIDVCLQNEITKVLDNMGIARQNYPKEIVLNFMAKKGYELKRTNRGIQYFVNHREPKQKQSRIIQLNGTEHK